jgi:hypothetical protein
VSETGLVYTFTTVKLQPIVTKPEGKSLIQACLNAPEQVKKKKESRSANHTWLFFVAKKKGTSAYRSFFTSICR